MEKLFTDLAGAIRLIAVILAVSACGSTKVIFKTGDDRVDVAVNRATLIDMGKVQNNEVLVFRFVTPFKSGLQSFCQADDEFDDLDGADVAAYLIARDAGGKEFKIGKCNASLDRPKSKDITWFAKVTAEPRLVPIEKIAQAGKTFDDDFDAEENSNQEPTITRLTLPSDDEQNKTDSSIAATVLNRITPELSDIKNKLLILEKNQTPSDSQVKNKKNPGKNQTSKQKKQTLCTVAKGQKVRVVTNNRADNIYLNNGHDLIIYHAPTDEREVITIFIGQKVRVITDDTDNSNNIYLNDGAKLVPAPK